MVFLQQTLRMKDFSPEMVQMDWSNCEGKAVLVLKSTGISSQPRKDYDKVIPCLLSYLI